MDCRNSNGFTLIELVLVVAISSILLTQVIPSFIDLIRSNRLASQANYFVAAVNFSRSEAIKRRKRVFICVRLGAGCDAGFEWENGWLVFVDRNRNGVFDAGETLRVFAPLAPGYILRGNINTSSLVFYENGVVRKGNGSLPMMSFRICAPDVVIGTVRERSREIVISQLGRMRYQFGREGVTKCVN